QRTPGSRGGRRAARNTRHHRVGPRTISGAGAQRPPLLRENDRAPPHDQRPAALGPSPRLHVLPTAAKGFFHLLARSRTLQKLAARYGMRGKAGFARRFIAGEDVDDAIAAARAVQERGLLLTLDYLGENVRSIDEAFSASTEYLRVVDAITAAGVE